MGPLGIEVAPYIFFSYTADCVLFNLFGIAICLYSLHVELSKEHDPKYRAYCDINEHMSCSKVLTSKYSIGFGVMHKLFGKNHILNARNCNMGMAIYAFNICCCLFLSPGTSSCILFYSSLFSVMGCFYLAFILFFVLKDVCLVCITIYVINGFLLYLNHGMYRYLQLHGDAKV